MDVNLLLLRIEQNLRENVNAIIKLRSGRTLKDDLSFVTDGDMAINSSIEQIAMNMDQNAIIISEEMEVRETDVTNQFLIVVDPIDGTENFTSGLPEWGVSVSCFEKGKHMGSLIGCPEMDIWLRSGVKVQKNFSRIRGLSSSLSKDDLVRATDGFEYRVMGCCVYNMINVIKGSFLSFENPRGAHSWDILGGLNLALENNLVVTVDENEYSGQYLPADRKYRFKVEHR